MYVAAICPILHFDGGKVVQTSDQEGNMATFQCDNGNILVGSGLRQCLQDRYWTGYNPVCQGILTIM